MRWILLVASLAGCEQWVASDRAVRDFTGPGTVTVQVHTTPDAYPRDPYGDAVRAVFYGDGELILADPGHEILQGGPDWVNVLDAWDDCPTDVDCTRTFRFDVLCEGPCEGEFLVDAFQSVHRAMAAREREGAIEITFPEIDGGGVATQP